MPVSDLTQLADEDLVRRASDGQEAAFRVLLERYSRRLHGRIRALVSPAVLRKISAADILQDAYLVAVRRLNEFDDRGEHSVARWLDRIVRLRVKAAVRHYVGTAKRSLRRELAGCEADELPAPAGKSPTPSQMAMANELVDHVVDAMEKLPPDQRDVLRLLQIEMVDPGAQPLEIGDGQTDLPALGFHGHLAEGEAEPHVGRTPAPPFAASSKRL